MSIQFVGAAVLKAKGEAALQAGMSQAGEHLLSACMAATPVDTGTLRASEHLTMGGGGSTVTATVSTGGESSEYAIYVHEGTSKMGARKYLEGPLVNNSPTYAAFLKAAVEAAF